MKNSCIIILGPTAVGKTALAVELASHLHTEIISADSRQCYTELNIGVAKPDAQELNTVKHHFISSHSIQQEVNAAVFESYALETIQAIFKQHTTAVMVGGTGLYIKAFAEGLDAIPQIPTATRERIITDYETNGLEWLQQEVQKKDPLFFATGEIHNPQRLMRALEIKLFTGESIVNFRTQQKRSRDFNIIKIGLDMPRELLYDRINKRVDSMMEQGLVEEARTVYPYRHLNALQTVGYRELFEYFDGNISLDRATALIKQNSRHYAKRQLTWFKRDEEIKWCDANSDVRSTIYDIVESLQS